MRGRPFPTVPHPDRGPPGSSGTWLEGQRGFQPSLTARLQEQKGQAEGGCVGQQQEGRQVSGGAGGWAAHRFHRSDTQGKDTGGCYPSWGLLLGGGDSPCLAVTRGMQAADPARPMRAGLCTQGCSRGSNWAREGPLFWMWASWSWAPSPPQSPSLGPTQHTGTAHNLSCTLAAGLLASPCLLMPLLPPSDPVTPSSSCRPQCFPLHTLLLGTG